jgi:hypothetical protein
MMQHAIDVRVGCEITGVNIGNRLIHLAQLLITQPILFVIVLKHEEEYAGSIILPILWQLDDFSHDFGQ